MEIIWHGYSCFSFKTKQATVVTNPYQAEYGNVSSLKGDIVILTNNFAGYDNVGVVEGEPHIIDWPGEYEIKGLAITMKEVLDEESKVPVATIMTLHDHNLRLCFLEKIGKNLTNELIENLGQVDILVVNIGGGDGMNAVAVHKLIEELEPRSVIPMHYSVDDIGKGFDPLDPFLKLVGGTAIEPIDKWNIQSRSQLKEDATEYVILKMK